jgi:prepilin-type N-terminal cleavage/methylation domain-containing protein
MRQTIRDEKSNGGFTLLELLIVVAIIAILAAIAIPNFLEAQTRAKAARTRSELKTIAVALESYAVDHGRYPDPLAPYKESLSTVHELSTPVAYLATTEMLDPFPPKFEDLNPPPPPSYQPTYWYDNYEGAFGRGMHKMNDTPIFPGFCLSSVGPDRESNSAVVYPLFMDRPSGVRNLLNALYDPTNGTVSGGDLVRWSGKAQRYQNF